MAQRTRPDLVTAKAVLGYAGRPFETLLGGTWATFMVGRIWLVTCQRKLKPAAYSSEPDVKST
jgi:hypothetical protein